MLQLEFIGQKVNHVRDEHLGNILGGPGQREFTEQGQQGVQHGHAQLDPTLEKATIIG